MLFEVVRADIASISADAIVLPANEKLKEGKGVSAAIFEAAGRKELTRACKKHGECPVGCAVPTPAYNLKAMYLIHAVVPKWIDGTHGEYDNLSSAYLSALNVADILGCESIAFPLLAAGNNGFDLELAVEIAEKSITHYESSRIKKIILVVYGQSVSALMLAHGYSVLEIPENLRKQEMKAAHQRKWEEIFKQGKEIAVQFAETQIENAIKSLSDPKNQEKIISMAVTVVKMVFSKGRKR